MNSINSSPDFRLRRNDQRTGCMALTVHFLMPTNEGELGWRLSPVLYRSLISGAAVW